MTTRNAYNVTEQYKQMTHDAIATEYIAHSSEDCVAALNISGDLNIGTMMRTACLFGMRHFYVVGRSHYDRRGNVGANKYIPNSTVRTTVDHQTFDADAICNFLRSKQDTHVIVYIEQKTDDSCVDLPLVNFKSEIARTTSKPVVFVVGNEAMGIPAEVMEKFPAFRVEIPQYGVMRSHNVATALSIVLWEYYRV